MQLRGQAVFNNRGRIEVGSMAYNYRIFTQFNKIPKNLFLENNFWNLNSKKKEKKKNIFLKFCKAHNLK